MEKGLAYWATGSASVRTVPGPQGVDAPDGLATRMLASWGLPAFTRLPHLQQSHVSFRGEGSINIS